MTWIPWKSMEASQSPRDHWTTSRRSLQPQRKRVAFTASNTKSPVKLEDKSSAIDITPPKNYSISTDKCWLWKTIDSFWNCLFPGDLLIFGWGCTIRWLQLAIFGWDEMSYGLHLHFWLPVDLLLTVWPTSHRIQTTPENPGRFLSLCLNIGFAWPTMLGKRSKNRFFLKFKWW